MKSKSTRSRPMFAFVLSDKGGRGKSLIKDMHKEFTGARSSGPGDAGSDANNAVATPKSKTKREDSDPVTGAS